MRTTKLSLLFVLSAASASAVIIGPGAPNQTGGSNLNDFYAAETFILPTAASIDSIRFWGLQAAAGDMGTIAWSLWSDVSGTPDSILTSGNAASPVVTLTGNNAVLGYLTELQIDFNLTSVNLNAGTYWLALTNVAPANPAGEFYWAWQNDFVPSGGSQSYDILSTGPWAGNFTRLAYNLTYTSTSTIPEPASFLLIGAGVGALWLGRRRLVQPHTMALLGFGALGLPAQNFPVLTPSATGQSATLRSLTPTVASGPRDVKVPNQLYIQRRRRVTATSRATIEPRSVASAVSTTFNQTTSGTLPVTVVSNYQGLGRNFGMTQGGAPTFVDQGVTPPDTTLAVGPTQIVQWVNSRYTVLDKTTGASLLPNPGYATGNSIWQGLPAGSNCRVNNSGDPIVQYDRMAGRWVLSQFAFPNSSGPFAICIAVSTTGDATGTYNLYQYAFTNLPDYPKLGVWHDGYYISINEFTPNGSGGFSFAGANVCAFDRAAMLAGNTANAVCTGRFTNRFSFLPSDIEGTLPPPTGTPNYVISTNWFLFNAPPYAIMLQKFTPNFANPPASTFNDGFGGGFNSFVSIPFDNATIGACADLGGDCVPQPGTTNVLDTLAMRPMYRLAYRNLGAGRESIYFTDSPDPAGPAVAGTRWLEIRSPGANPPVVFHNSTFNPGNINRWMGAVASDKLGNMAIGYAVSSSTVSPSIRIAGRLRNDVRNQLRGELEVGTGSGNMVNFTRFGDYSTMQIDPADDCTFWYTQMYTTTSSQTDWATRIVGFKFNSCQ